MEDHASKYILYVKKKCPFCIKALELLKIYEVQHEVICVDESPQLLSEMKSAWKWDTVPMVFEYQGDNPLGSVSFVGGYTDLEKKFSDE
jgi:glutaredoxin